MAFKPYTHTSIKNTLPFYFREWRLDRIREVCFFLIIPCYLTIIILAKLLIVFLFALIWSTDISRCDEKQIITRLLVFCFLWISNEVLEFRMCKLQKIKKNRLEKCNCQNEWNSFWHIACGAFILAWSKCIFFEPFPKMNLIHE